ncbi:phage baseplate protein [Brucella sp. 2280]|uniref:phage baseplate protein n=1 Tax=Brucella sp. 2280 TaxID=2592625 RepID=UPI00129720FC|nr:phage baseplate protein [Brucella sp. 2280]QGA56350.1 phage baseplate protein [Brucella sp. 2280]
MTDIIVRELLSLRKSIDDLERRLAASHMTGKVVAVDGDRVRLELQPEDSRTGKPFLSPWVQVQEAAGSTGTHFPVAIGDPIRLFSPNGEFGSQSIAIRDGYTDDAKSPAKNGELAIAHGGCALRFADGVATIEASEIIFKSNALKHNEKNVGDTHTHGGVERGGSNTREPNE